MLYYGLTKETEVKELSKIVCDCLGYGGNHTAMDLLIETVGAETYHGKVQDRTKLAGMGLCQFDELPFQDVKDRTSKSNKLKVFKTFGIHIDYVTWESLRYNPLLSLIFCRLKYKLIREEIPPDVIGRANYWKKWYNSYKGKGTIEHYLKSNGYDIA